MFNAHLLGCDAYFRPSKSYYASSFFSDAAKVDYFNVLLACKLPTFMSDILQELAPVYDPRRTNHLFVPTLAAYSHSHDFGRAIPPQVFLHCHQYLATANQRSAPTSQQSDIYNLLITTFGTQTFHIGNYFGTSYGNYHDNWLNSDFEGFFNPIVGRALTQKPTFGKLALTQQTYADHQSMDMYEHFLVCDDDNIDKMSNFMGSISVFFQTQAANSLNLGTTLATLSGSLLFSHSIEPPTLPTWTGMPIKENASDPKNHKEFATKHEFLVAAPVHTGTLAWLDDDTNLITGLYRLLQATFAPAQRFDARITFDKTAHVTPYVLYFQPYDVNASSLALTIICGIKIETAELDGFTIPSEHPEDSLDDNNSQYLQSAIRLSNVHATLAQADPSTSHVTLLARRHVDRDNQAHGFAFRDMSRVVMPRFANAAVNDMQINAHPSTGYHVEDNHDDPRSAFTYTAGQNGTLDLGTDNKAYLWSSYRVVHKNKKPELKDISMIASFRPVYGSNVTLSRSKNPSLIIPH
jgi:hypothetical protein